MKTFMNLLAILSFVFSFRSSVVIGLVSNSPSKCTAGSSSAIKASSSTAGKEKKPFEFGRFIKTLAFYDFIPIISSIQKVLSFKTKSSIQKSLTKGFTLWSPSKPDLLEFGPLDDVVMGGASKSDLIPGQRFDGNWTGFTTSANNGGFAGIRCKMLDPELDVSKCEGIELKLTGDGQRYKFIARDDTNWNGVAWSYSFDTKPKSSMKIQIPFKKLRPTRFAKTVPGGKPFNQKSLRGLQLSLSKFEYDGGFNPSFKEGKFELRLEEIKTY